MLQRWGSDLWQRFHNCRKAFQICRMSREMGRFEPFVVG